MKTLFLGAFLIGLAFLGFQQDDTLFAASGDRASDAPLKLVAGDLGGRWPADPATVEEASIAGDLLTLRISYPGGCRVHGFRLIVSDDFAAGIPAAATARLSHDAFGDTCVATVREQLRVDLAPVRQAFETRFRETAGELLIELDGRELRYAF